MRQLNYLSPTAVNQWYKDRESFYCQRLADFAPPRDKQTQPMSVGSAFDAFVKGYLYSALFGNYGPEVEKEIAAIDAAGKAGLVKLIGPSYSPHFLLLQQVEPHNREWATIAGRRCFEMYKESGALADLMKELQAASSPPQFEFRVEKNICHETDLNGVPLLGYPDLFFRSASGRGVILDFKVNSYCANSPASPKKGYVKVRDGWQAGAHGAPEHTRSHNSQHKDAHLRNVDGIILNYATFLEDVDESWAGQTACYSWLLGEKVGADFTVGIEQLVGCGQRIGAGGANEPLVRVASHRCRISPIWQHEWFGKIAHVWRTCQRGPKFIFEDLGMNQAESEERCSMLDIQYKAYQGNEAVDQFFAIMMGK